MAGPVGHILLDRPDAMNAITVELGRQLEEALVSLAPQVSVIVIRGSNGNFSVGGDFRELERLRSEGPGAMAGLFDNFSKACSRIKELDVPVIAAVEGYAMAGGFELMQACDIVLVHEKAKLADTHSNHGQIPGGGSSQRLPRLVGRQRALAHILTGERITAAEAVAWGLAYRALPARVFDEAVEDFAAKLAAKNRDALAKSKKLIYAALELPLDEGLKLERDTVLAHLSGEAAGAGINSFTGRGKSA
ncbi:enoyl-CoA hydratase/isomerase family protein [bacterium RCC_150]